MSTIKSYSVGNGDMFYINHNSDNFTIIDCCIGEDNDWIIDQIATLSKKKGITRFISTHPDDDHLRGLELLDEKIGIVNFYCVKNAATKADETDSFTKYRELRDHEKKAFHIFAGCSRKWMNLGSEERGQSGINILWPDMENPHYVEELAAAADGQSPNNLSAIIKYSVTDGVSALWMGDLETDFMEKIEDEVEWPVVDILFAPHHGRESGKIPERILQKIKPKIIVIGEAPSEHLNYYTGYNVITQNSAGHIVFECEQGKVHIFTSQNYSVDFLDDESWRLDGYQYIGTLNLKTAQTAAAA
jgi:beta-lactamase superfamily II metal-dependent hydrolase